MRPKPSFLVLALAVAGCGTLPAGEHAHHAAPAADARQAIDFPEPLRTHTLANMRDHLAALQEIQQALGEGAPDRAAQVAENRLGMTSLRSHGAHDVAKFMPAGMQALGSQMHRAASRFALEAGNAGATGEMKPALAALAAVTAQCVACHAAYRMK